MIFPRCTTASTMSWLLVSGCAWVAALALHEGPALIASQELRAERLALPEGTQLQRDMVYCSPEGIPLKLDLYRPLQGSHRPLAIYVHGGGWHGGDKAVGADLTDFPELVRRGYAVASINYRHAPLHRFPAQLHDVKCAVRFLRAHASEFGIDEARIGAWGASAGGHLVALAALTPGHTNLEGTAGHMDQSSSIAAAVVYYGPAELAAGDLPVRTRGIIARVFGDTLAELEWGSPATYVHTGAPPFLLVHGDADTSVPLSQSKRLYDRLRRAGVPAEFVIVRNAGHVFEPAGAPIEPDRATITRLMADFFDRTLRRHGEIR